MEFDFPDFRDEYRIYDSNESAIEISVANNVGHIQNHQRLVNIHGEFKNLDVKMRLAFGISSIRLNGRFVSEKEGDLKLCHLLYYKLADLWFAYETYIKLFAIIAGAAKHKILWLDAVVHNDYFISPTITRALDLANEKFTLTYASTSKRNELVEYLEYSAKQGSKSQKSIIAAAVEKINQRGPSVLTHTELLAMIYAIRNNFVHNGETTVVPNIFGYSNKSVLLNILYPYLCLILLASTNITCARI
jgi:hypothetical protein